MLCWSRLLIGDRKKGIRPQPLIRFKRVTIQFLVTDVSNRLLQTAFSSFKADQRCVDSTKHSHITSTSVYCLYQHNVRHHVRFAHLIIVIMWLRAVFMFADYTIWHLKNEPMFFKRILALLEKWMVISFSAVWLHCKYIQGFVQTWNCSKLMSLDTVFGMKGLLSKCCLTTGMFTWNRLWVEKCTRWKVLSE